MKNLIKNQLFILSMLISLFCLKILEQTLLFNIISSLYGIFLVGFILFFVFMSGIYLVDEKFQKKYDSLLRERLKRNIDKICVVISYIFNISHIYIFYILGLNILACLKIILITLSAILLIYSWPSKKIS